MRRTTGILELPPDRPDGRLRRFDKSLVIEPGDPLVPARLIAELGLRPGLLLGVEIGNNRGPEPNGKKKKKKKSKTQKEIHAAPRVEPVLHVDETPRDKFQIGPALEDRVTVDPQPRLTLEYPACPPACRLIDLFCPIGYGQRGLIVSPPKAGKTTLLQNIAGSLEKNHPDLIVWSLLIDERPEEVTDFRRNVPCEVIASSNDHTAERHVGLFIAAIERAKRLAEQGKDIVILLDSLTRVGRAFNVAPGVVTGGRTLSGGLDIKALAVPKQLFGAARNIEDGGSLTIIATCLIDTGSRGDQVIFEEFKGTGNMEMILSRDIANQRVFPAIDLAASGTRKEHLLLDEKTLETVTALRRRLMNMKPLEQVEQLLKAVEHYKTNDALVGKAQQPTNAA